jgi:hypothetical protein
VVVVVMVVLKGVVVVMNVPEMVVEMVLLMVVVVWLCWCWPARAAVCAFYGSGVLLPDEMRRDSMRQWPRDASPWTSVVWNECCPKGSRRSRAE